MATKMSHGVPDLTRVCPYPLPRGIMSKRSPLETVTWCPRCDASVPGDGWRPSDPVDIWSLASPSVPAADVRPATLTKPDGEAWIIFPEHFPSSPSFPWSPSVSKESKVHIWARWWKWWLLTLRDKRLSVSQCPTSPPVSESHQASQPLSNIGPCWRRPQFYPQPPFFSTWLHYDVFCSNVYICDRLKCSDNRWKL